MGLLSQVILTPEVIIITLAIILYLKLISYVANYKKRNNTLNLKKVRVPKETPAQPPSNGNNDNEGDDE